MRKAPGYTQSLEEWTVSVPDNTSPAYTLNRRYYYGTRLLRQDRVASAAADYYTYDGLRSVSPSAAGERLGRVPPTCMMHSEC